MKKVILLSIFLVSFAFAGAFEEYQYEQAVKCLNNPLSGNCKSQHWQRERAVRDAERELEDAYRREQQQQQQQIINELKRQNRLLEMGY